MKINVKHVAKLANLKLTDEEIAKFEKQLTEILSYVEELEKVDTASVEPTSQTTGLTNVTRHDQLQTQRTLDIEQVFLNAKNRHKNYFSVNAVIDKDNV